MAKIVWDAPGEHWYETGVDHGVLYTMGTDGRYNIGVPWNGLTAVTESPDGAEPTDLWADNIKYATLRSAETFGFTIEAYTYPSEFMICDGTAVVTEGVYLGQQARRAFGFCYRTDVGNEQDSTSDVDHNYKIHIIYNATASPSERNYETINDSPDAITFSWDCDTTPVSVTGYRPVSTITIDSRYCDAAKLQALEETLYGTSSLNPTLLSPDAVIALLTTTNTDTTNTDTGSGDVNNGTDDDSGEPEGNG